MPEPLEHLPGLVGTNRRFGRFPPSEYSYEISKEVAMAMFADYRNEIYRSRKWAPDYREEDLQMEELQDLKTDNEKENAAKKKDKKWERKTKS